MRVMRIWKVDRTRRVQWHSAKRRFAPFLERVESRELLSSLWSRSVTPAVASENDPNAVEVGVKFTSDVAGYISGILFYKGPSNTGTHVGHLWTDSGTLLATATFTNETASGWQEVDFATPVAIAANTTYVASYFAPAGGYAVDDNYFANSGYDNAPLHAPANGADGGNGVYVYGSDTFPTESYQSSNYWVDVDFEASTSPPVVTEASTSPPVVTAFSPAAGATGVDPGNTKVTVTFNQPVQISGMGFPGNFSLNTTSGEDAAVAAGISYDSATSTATLTPYSPLAPSTTYRVMVSGIENAAGTPMSSPTTWTFTTGMTSD
jgi:hypothetical protein